MKFKYLTLLLILCSCTAHMNNKYEKKMFNSKGFAYIYETGDYETKLIKKRIDNSKLLIGHSYLKRGTLLKLSNPKNGKNIILKNNFKINYPTFYNILITNELANILKLDHKLPYVEIEEVKQNKSFIAERADIYEEEKQIHDNAPVEKVKINNLSKNQLKKTEKKARFVIILGNFYSLESANGLKKRLKNESSAFNNKKITISKKNKHNYEVFLGPYNTIKKIKNDYIALEKLNFDEIDVKIYD